MEKTEQKGLNIGVRSFVTAIAVIFALMVAAYLLTLTIPGGTYTRVEDAAGHLVIDTVAGFSHVEGGIPFWKWVLSPILVLGASGSSTLLAVIAFLLAIGGVFTMLDRCGLMAYILHKTTSRFRAVRCHRNGGLCAGDPEQIGIGYAVGGGIVEIQSPAVEGVIVVGGNKF